MTLIELTLEQEELFKEVVGYLSNERKSAGIQLFDSEIPKTAAEAANDFKTNFTDKHPEYLSRDNIKAIIKRALSPLELVTLEQVPGMTRVTTQAARLTEKGAQFKRYSGFTLERMARFFDQSIYPVLSTMNSTTDNVRPYQAVNLLYMLEDKGPTFIEDLIVNSPNRIQMYRILNDLTIFKDSKGNPIPLIEITEPNLPKNQKGFYWVEGSPAHRITGKTTEEMKNLLETLYSNPERVWTAKELGAETGYSKVDTLLSALQRLQSNGNVKSGYQKELRKAQITVHGRLMIYTLFETIKEDIADDVISSRRIDRNQPTPDSLVRVLGLYVGIKNQERSISTSTPTYQST